MALDIDDTAVYTAVKAFAALVVPADTPIQRGQQNRVPMPNTSCVILTTLGAPNRIGTNGETVEAVVVDNVLTGFTAAVSADFEYRVQADFYSPVAESWAMAAELLWRGTIGFNAMPAGMKPLYSEDRRQAPIIGAEDQFLQRWILTLVLDYQPTWTQPTEAATSLTIVAEAVEVYFPPSDGAKAAAEKA